MRLEDIEEILGVSQVRAIEATVIAAIEQSESAGAGASDILQALQELLVALFAATAILPAGGGAVRAKWAVDRLNELIEISNEHRNQTPGAAQPAVSAPPRRKLHS